jgi:hypothetical protein
MNVCGGAGRKLALVVIVMSELVLKDHRARSGKVLGVRHIGIGHTPRDLINTFGLVARI